MQPDRHSGRDLHLERTPARASCALSRDGLVDGGRVRPIGRPDPLLRARGRERRRRRGSWPCCRDGGNVLAAVREPGGAWGAPAVAPVRRVEVRGGRRGRFRAAATRSSRGPRSTLPRPAIAGTARYGEHRARLRGARGARRTYVDRAHPGIAANGDAVVLWTTRERERAPRRNAVKVAVAAGRRPLRARRPRRRPAPHSTASLAVAADGHALVALADGEALLVAERAPGGTFGARSARARARSARRADRSDARRRRRGRCRLERRRARRRRHHHPHRSGRSRPSRTARTGRAARHLRRFRRIIGATFPLPRELGLRRRDIARHARPPTAARWSPGPVREQTAA